MTALSPVDRALALAAELDRTLVREAYTDETAEALLIQIGEAAGGLSIHGLQSDVKAMLDDAREREIEEAAPREYWRGMGGNDPWHGPNGDLPARIQRAQDYRAAEWLREVAPLVEQARRVAA